MMRLGPMGSGAGGNSSSSTSNLSALAPPFTVDRLNPKPNSNPNLHYSDPLYTAEPYSHGWPYASPSAPIPELAFESTGVNRVPSSDDYRTISPASTHWSPLNSGTKTSASAVAYGGTEVKHYYSPYVPPLVGGEDSLLVEDGESNYDVGPILGPSLKSQIDYTSILWDVNYEAPWVDNMGFDDGKRAKREELDGSFFEKANLGGSGPHSYGNQLSVGGFCTEKNKKKSTEDSGVSYKKLNHASDGEIHTGSASVLRTKDKSCHEQNLGFVPYDSNQTCTSEYISTYPEPYYKNFLNEQNSIEKFVKRVDKPIIGPVSATMSSPTVVIRPPPATNGKSGQRTFSRKLARFENVECADFCSKPNSQIKEGSFQTNLFDIPKQGNGLISSSELASPLDSRDPFDLKIKARFEPQLPEVNILGGFNMACDSSIVQAVNSTDNVQVDSPCWKGASSLSQFSSIDMEASNLNHAKKNMDEYFGLDLEEHQKNLSVIDTSQDFSEKARERIKNIEKNECGAICSTKEHSLFDGVKGIKTGNDTKSSKIECLISEGAVAVHAAEKVLASPASQEEAAEHTMLPYRKLNVPTVLRAMHNLSELLLFHLSSDTCFLEKENTETIENIIRNLYSCLNDNANEASKKLEPNSAAVGHASDKSPKLHDVGTTLGSPQHMHEEEKEYRFSGKKDEKSPILSSLGDDLDVTRDDDMTKAIKKVLEENFKWNEEKHSRAFFYRNLWLDAEAKLCSVSYKARFDRMKIQMEQINMKAPQGIDDTEEILSEICNTASELGLKGHDGPILKSTIQNLPFSMSGPPDGVESSVMARFNILKSREENVKPINTEDEQQKPKMVDNDEHGDSVTTRFNILKSREENSAKLISTDEVRQSKMIAGGFSSSDWCVGPCIISPPEVENFNVGPKEGAFGPYARGAGYGTLEEFNLSVTNDPVVRSFTNGRMMMEQSSLGRRDSSSSDWEHVMKDDLSWKNL
ncbi:hypothetical protein OROHE_021797 [Orobanche hederae]